MSIRTRLMLTALLVCVLCSAGGFLLLHQHLAASARQRAHEDIEAKATLVEATIDEGFAQAERAAATLVESQAVIDFARRPGGSPLGAWTELQLVRDLSGDVELQLLDRSGAALIRVGDPVRCDAVLAHPFVRAQVERGLGAWWLPVNSVPTRVVLAPISEDDRRLGLVIASRAMPSLEQLAGSADAHLVLIVDGEVLAHTFDQDTTAVLAEVLAEAAATPPRQVAVAGQRHYVREVELNRTAGTAPMRLVLLDEAAPASGGAILGRLMAMGGLGLALAWGLIWLVTRSYIRPLRRLEAFARRAADGEGRPVERHASAPEIAVVEDALNDWLRLQSRMRTYHEGDVRDARDREIDRWIQGSMSPEVPEMEGYDLAVGSWRAPEAGGDCCALIPGANGSLWIAAGTLATTGLRAGMLNTLLTGALEAAVQISPAAPPTLILRVLDRLLARYLARVGWEDSFAALRLVRLGPDGGVAFAGAHDEMWLARADGTASTAHDWTGLWLGLEDAARQDTANDPDGQLLMGAGDTLMLVTHGVTSAQDEVGRFLGSRGVRDVLESSREQPSRVIRDRLMKRWTEWVREPSGDATVVVIRRRTGALTTAR